MTESFDPNLAHSLIAYGKQLGASDLEILVADTMSVAITRRLGAIEHLERSESYGIGIRVVRGQQQAIVSSSNPDFDHLKALTERAIAMAKVTPNDPYLVLSNPSQHATNAIEPLDLFDSTCPSAESLLSIAAQAEETALNVPGITNSEGVSCSYSKSTFSLITSTGFSRYYSSSSFDISAGMVAGTGTHMEQDYAYSIARHFSDLVAPEEIGKQAAERAIRRLNPRTLPTKKMPVVFDPRVARSLISHFTSAINGISIARGSSFLKDSLGKPLFDSAVSIIEDPFRVRGLASRPFDGEGVVCQRRALIEKGILTGWLLDLRSAKQLNLTTTGNASRSFSSPPSPSASNLYMEPGTLTPKELMADIEEGLYVTDLFGMGVHLLTGDYSQGATGFYIHKGELTYPVSEITIAGNLMTMYQHLTPANDLEFRYSTNAPTLRVEGMTVAGQ